MWFNLSIFLDKAHQPRVVYLIELNTARLVGQEEAEDEQEALQTVEDSWGHGSLN